MDATLPDLPSGGEPLPLLELPQAITPKLNTVLVSSMSSSFVSERRFILNPGMILRYLIRMTKLFWIFGSLLVVLLLVGCGAASEKSTSPSTSAGTISTGTRTVDGTVETTYVHHGPVSAANTRHVIVRNIPHLGAVLVDGKGFVLYAFVPDRGGTGACTHSCALTWPPIRLTIELAIDTSPALSESLVSTEPDPEGHHVGDRVVKFAGRVLHTYTGDTSPGEATGQGLHSNGGRWYVTSPSGKLVTSKR